MLSMPDDPSPLVLKLVTCTPLRPSDWIKFIIIDVITIIKNICMLNIFKKKKKDYYILKLYKTVNQESAAAFPSKDYLTSFFVLLNNYYNLPDRYDLNYGQKEFKNFNNFENRVLQKGNTDIVYLGAYYTSSQSRVTFTNNALNSTSNSSTFSYLSIILLLDINFFESNLFREVIEMGINFEFDYGYGYSADENYNFDRDQKNKTSLFGTSYVVTQEDIEYEKLIPEFKSGLVKKIYPYNLVNNNQMKSYIIINALKSREYKSSALNNSMSLVNSKLPR